MQELQREVLQIVSTIIIKQGSFTLLQIDIRNHKMEDLIYYKAGKPLLQWGHVLKICKFIAKRPDRLR